MTTESHDTNRKHTGCHEAAELLPWFLNGTLSAEEKALVESHLDACESCRTELEETVEVWGLVSTHIPSLALAEYAQGLEPRELGREQIEQHLASCPSCRAELELALPDAVIDFAAAREQRIAAAPAVAAAGNTDADVVPFRPARLALAAGLAAAAITGSLLWNTEVLQPSSSSRPAEAVVAHRAVEPSLEETAPATSTATTNTVFSTGFEDMSGWTKVVDARTRAESTRN